MNVVVADTGPLLHLHEIDAAPLLGHFGTIHVTDLEHRSTLWMSAKVRHAALQALLQIYRQP